MLVARSGGSDADTLLWSVLAAAAATATGAPAAEVTIRASVIVVAIVREAVADGHGSRARKHRE
jgi:PP-loop superfamily ATP-utilizing enzyme